jgi:hypothetical protein
MNEGIVNKKRPPGLPVAEFAGDVRRWARRRTLVVEAFQKTESLPVRIFSFFYSFPFGKQAGQTPTNKADPVNSADPKGQKNEEIDTPASVQAR